MFLLKRKADLTAARRQSGNKTWADFEALHAALSDLCDKRYGENRGQLSLYVDDKAHLIMKVGGTEYRASGNDPWEAAATLATGATSLAVAINKLLWP
jgi:hypothetical protein